MNWYDINNIAFELLGYPLSYIELLGTIFGLLSVALAARTNIWTWPTGIINEFAFFILFFQVQLYSDMFLQVYFFGVTLYGWYFWNKNPGEQNITSLSRQAMKIYGGILLAGTIGLGLLISQIHLLLPDIFTLPAAYPFPDAFTTTASILATILLARKQIETWLLWIFVDVVSIVLYFLKGINFVAIEYCIFLAICVAGYMAWKKKL